MHGFNPLVAINLALCQQYFGVSLQAMERLHRLNVASFEALLGGAEAALEAGGGALERRATGVDMVTQWARASEVFGTLPHGLSHLVAEYAADMGDG